jgi:high-affinity iron transporter
LYLWGGVVAGVVLAGPWARAAGLSELLSGDAQTYFQTAMVLIAAC